MTRFLRLRSLALALTTLAAAGPLAACAAAPPQITIHTEKANPGDHQMVVTGTATLQVSPDCADLTMTMTARSVRPGAAVSEVRARQVALVAALHKLDIADGDLKLSTLGVQPAHEWNPQTGQAGVLLGYDARITLTVTTRAFEKIGPLMEAGADAGVTEMASQFRRSDLDKLKTQVREQALLAARDKARQIAGTLDITLGGISSVSEQSSSYLYSNAYFPRAANVQTSMDGSGGQIGGELLPLTLDVTVTYELPARG